MDLFLTQRIKFGHSAEQRWTRQGQPISPGTPLFIIWKRNDFEGPYQNGLGYAGHLPTDKESAEWYAEKTAERLRTLYWWQQDVVFDVLPYQPKVK